MDSPLKLNLLDSRQIKDGRKNLFISFHISSWKRLQEATIDEPPPSCTQGPSHWSVFISWTSWIKFGCFMQHIVIHASHRSLGVFSQSGKWQHCSFRGVLHFIVLLTFSSEKFLLIPINLHIRKFACWMAGVRWCTEDRQGGERYVCSQVFTDFSIHFIFKHFWDL